MQQNELQENPCVTGQDAVLSSGGDRSWLKQVGRGGGTERPLPAASAPVPAITQMLSQHLDHHSWRDGKQEGGGSEMGGLKMQNLSREELLLLPEIVFLSAAVPPSPFG